MSNNVQFVFSKTYVSKGIRMLEYLFLIFRHICDYLNDTAEYVHFVSDKVSATVFQIYICDAMLNFFVLVFDKMPFPIFLCAVWCEVELEVVPMITWILASISILPINIDKVFPIFVKLDFGDALEKFIKSNMSCDPTDTFENLTFLPSYSHHYQLTSQTFVVYLFISSTLSFFVLLHIFKGMVECNFASYHFPVYLIASYFLLLTCWSVF